MKRRLKIFLAISAVVLVICGVGGWFFYGRAKDIVFVVQDEAQAYGDYALEEIAQKWDFETLRRHASPEFIANSDDETMKRWLAKMQRLLGDFKSVKSKLPTLVAAKDSHGDNAIAANYDAEAVFEKEVVKVKMRLFKREVGDWGVSLIDFQPKNRKSGPSSASAPTQNL